MTENTPSHTTRGGMAWQSKRKPGRPTKLTPELQDEICGYIADGMTYADACRLVEHKPYYFPELAQVRREWQDGTVCFLSCRRNARER